MPRLIAPGALPAVGLDELVDQLDADPFDPRDEDAFAARGPLLAALARDRGFLAELALAELKTRCRDQARVSSYGCQVLLLRPSRGHYGLRANFWPALDDPAVRASGPAAFFYGHAHDHNFSFLTVGYLGPGYASEHYERDPAAPCEVGAPAGLRRIGREVLGEGDIWLYRRHRDVHAQLPPASFSVSLNLLGCGADQAWTDQLRFDLATGCVAEALTFTPSQALLTTSVAAGLPNAIDLAEDFARTHPSGRMRAAAERALAFVPTVSD